MVAANARGGYVARKHAGIKGLISAALTVTMRTRVKAPAHPPISGPGL
jgi:hypothetical protein